MEAKCQEQEPQENDVDSPLSGDEATEGIYEPSPKKRFDILFLQHFLVR